MPRFRKRPIEVEAVQWTEWGQDVPGVCHEQPKHEGAPEPERHLIRPHVHTLEGPLRVSPGDWIIKGVEGEFYPCKASVFEATYEPVVEQTPGEVIRHAEPGGGLDLVRLPDGQVISRCTRCGKDAQ